MFSRVSTKALKTPIQRISQRSMSNFLMSEEIDMMLQPTDEQREIRDAVRVFTQKEILPIQKQIEYDGVLPRDMWNKLGELGVLTPTVEADYDGLNLGYLEHCLITEEISRVSPSLGFSYAAHSNLCANNIRLNGTEEQKLKYLPKLATGEHVGALAMSEPNAGSDVVSLQLSAKIQEDGSYILNGSKMWITNGPIADTIVVYARSDPNAGSKGLTAFIVEKDFKGFSVAQVIDKIGMRGSPTGELVFDNVHVPAENVLGKDGEGVKVMMRGLDSERIILSANNLGMGQGAIDATFPYLVERKQFNQAIVDFQMVQGQMAKMYSDTQSSRSYLYAIARCLDSGKNVRNLRKDAAAVFYDTGKYAADTIEQGLLLMGGVGATTDLIHGALLGSVQIANIAGGTQNIRQYLCARELIEGLRKGTL